MHYRGSGTETMKNRCDRHRGIAWFILLQMYLTLLLSLQYNNQFCFLKSPQRPPPTYLESSASEQTYGSKCTNSTLMQGYMKRARLID